LAEARALGDELVVGISSDESRRRLKGPGHPIVGESDRSAMLEFLKPVSSAIIVDEGSILNLLKKLKPQILYTVKDEWGKTGIRKREEAKYIKSYGGRVIKVLKEFPYLSSSEMVDRVADLKIKQVIEYFMGKVDLKPYSGKRSEAAYFNPKAKESVLSFSKPNVPSSLLGLLHFGKIIGFKNLSALGADLEKAKKKVVFTAVGGDLLHIGHAKFLAKARGLGDVLVVGIPSNASMRRQKGAGRPIIDEKARAELLCYLKPVDYVVVFPQDTVLQTLKDLKPGVFQTVKDSWNKGFRKSPEYRLVRAYGGHVIRVEKQARGVSATYLINKAAKIRLNAMFKECLGKE
jgi:rfaE bifunctional protein nucleotidyltransferase chain/domain